MKGNPMEKYKLQPTDFTTPAGKPLFRVVALRDSSFAKAGELGGYIEGETNLSHEGDCWVSGNARVYGDARVYGNAWVGGDARVYGNAEVSGDAQVYGDARVGGNARFTGGYAFATKTNSWDITEVNNTDGTTTLYANAVFEPTEPKPHHSGQADKFCSECGEKL